MPRMTFIDANLIERVVAFDEGSNVMSTAVNNDIVGIDGECGGEMSCGTCHVYVSPPWQQRLSPQSTDESDMIGVVDNPRPESRLGCQIELSSDLDGLTVTVAATTL